MSSKKETKQLSQEEHTQVENLFTHYQQLAQQLYAANDNVEQLKTMLADVFQAPEAVQLALLKNLGRTNDSAAADVASAINTLSPHKEIRKEARRALIRLESSKTYPKWKAPAAIHAPAVQLPVSNAPRFWKGYVSQTREEGEINLLLLWEQGYEYNEAYMFAFMLDFWHEGVKDFFTESGTKRHIEERIGQLEGRDAVLQLTSCTLAEGKRLLLEALSVNQWHKTTPHESYRMQQPLINNFILNASEESTGPDSGRTFIAPDMEPQEVVANFIGGWSFGDFGLAYDLLSSDNPLRKELTRDEWIEQHRAWFDEAHPARIQLGFVHEKPQQQSTLWVPSTVKRAPSTKILEVGWSLELNDTLLSGTLAEMPMGTAVNKDTRRNWFWTNFTLVQEHKVWRIQQIQDQGSALQGLSARELERRIKEHENILKSKTQQDQQNLEHMKPEEILEEFSWRLTQMLHLDDALLVQQTSDYHAHQRAYEHAVMIGDPERIVSYLERMAQRFPEQKVEMLRRLGATLTEMSFLLDQLQMKERKIHLQKRAEEALREALTIEDNALNHSLLAELLISLERNEEAQAEFETALAQLSTEENEQELRASIEAGLGNVEMRLQHYAQAISHYQKVAELNPEYTGIWFSLGFAHRLLHKPEQAEHYYQKALEQEPGDPRTYSDLAALYMQRQENAKAQALLEQGLKINPNSSYLHALLASVLAESGDRRQAQRHIEEAQRLDPQSEIIPALREQINSVRRHG